MDEKIPSLKFLQFLQSSTLGQMMDDLHEFCLIADDEDTEEAKEVLERISDEAEDRAFLGRKVVYKKEKDKTLQEVLKKFEFEYSGSGDSGETLFYNKSFGAYADECISVELGTGNWTHTNIHGETFSGKGANVLNEILKAHEDANKVKD